MKLATNLWLENGFYIDIDHLGQLRVVGPGDHLYFGMINENEKRNYEIGNVYLKDGDLFITGYFFGPRAKFFYPITGDIRTVRTYIYKKWEKVKSFYEVRKEYHEVLAPEKISEKKIDDKLVFSFERLFGDHFYGSELILDNKFKVSKRKNHLLISNSEVAINFTLKIYSSHFFRREITEEIFAKKEIDFNKFGENSEDAQNILNRAKIEVEHLLKYRKTSGFDYGTVFPRDWTEAAVLGFDDFNKETLRYIIHESLKYIEESGKGWHESDVGEYGYTRHLRHLSLVTREMIDIEPRYMLIFGMFPEIFLSDEVLLKKIQRVASFIYKKAENYPFIYFEDVHFQCGEIGRSGKPRNFCFKAGNWRDSSSAYLNISSRLIPYDVNAVFYPAALEIIKKYADTLEIKDKKLPEVVENWQNKKELFKFENKDGNRAYALALFDYKDEKEFKRFEVNHTDEAYDLIFGEPQEEDVRSFAERILSDKYFYTHSGPLIIGKNQGYNSKQYHGEVIWLKQIGLLSMGFRKQLERNDFSEKTKELAREVIRYLFKSLVYIYDYLNMFPELVVDKNGAPLLYNEQDIVEGHMNKIQLWSAEAARRVILDYYDVFKP